MPIMLFLILILIFVILLVVVTNIVIVPQSMVYVVERLGQLLRDMERRPSRQDPVPRAGGEESQPERAGRRLSPSAGHHPR